MTAGRNCIKACKPIFEWPLKPNFLRPPPFSTSAQPSAPPLSYKEIPGLKSLPFVGSVPFFFTRKEFNLFQIHKFWASLYEEFGPIFKMNLPFGRTICIKDPEDIELVHKVTQGNPRRPQFHCLLKVRYDNKEFFQMKGGLLIENEEEWWRIRKGVQAPMMKLKKVAKYLQGMDEISLDFIDRIAEFQSKYGEMPENFQIELNKFTLENVAYIAFNRRLGCLDPDLKPDSLPAQFIRAGNDLFEYMWRTEIKPQFWKIFPTPTYKKFRNAHNTMLRIADAYIKETEERLQSKRLSEDDELTLMETFLCNPELCRRDIVTLILDMLSAGVDTTSNTIAFTLYLLARNPSKQVLLQQEIDEVLGEGTKTLTENHLVKFSYLKACVKESLRTFPLAIGTVRELQSDTVIKGYLIPKGTHAFMHNFMPSWEEKWFPRTNEFLPERWLRHQPMGATNPYASLPFSTGTRMCIGRRIAEQEIYTFLARVMQRYTVEYEYEDIQIRTNLISVPSQPLRFKFLERKKSK